MSADRVREIPMEEDFLNTDTPIRGQEFVCLSFLSPEKVLEKKELFFFQRFMKFYEAKIRYEMLEKFLAEFGNRHNAALDLSIKYAADCAADEVASLVSSQTESEDASGATVNVEEVKTNITEILVDKMSGSKVNLADVFESFRTYVESHRTEVASKENIEDAYKEFMYNKEQELEDEFHAKNDFRTSIRGVKVRGSYASHKEACVRAKRLQKEDPAHDVFVGQVGYWLPWDPSPHSIEDQEYAEKELNELMKSHKEKQAMKKELFEAEKKRKVDAAKKAVEENSRTVADDGAAAVASSDSVRNIAEAREIMAEMEANRIPVNPSQVRETLDERSAEAEAEAGSADVAAGAAAASAGGAASARDDDMESVD